MKLSQRRPLHRAWPVFIGLCVYYFVAFGLLFSGFGLFLPSMSTDLGIPYVQLSVTNTVRVLAGMLTTALMGRVFPRVRLRRFLSVILLLLVGTLVVLCAAEWANCRDYCGLAASIAVILMISHFESSVYLHSLMRAVQTIVGVSIAWLVNVKLFPYPATKGSLSAWLLQRRERRSTLRAEAENAEQDAASVSDTDREDVDECGYKDCKS